MRNRLMTQVMAGLLVAAGWQQVRAEEAPAAPDTGVDTYVSDSAHGKIGFRVKHLMIARVSGEFTDYTATVQLADGKLAGAEAVIQAASIDTSNADRDKHLRTADFFDVEQFPTLTFKSTGVMGDKLVGDLTIHGVTKSVELDCTVSGPIMDPWGKSKLGLELSGKISRSDFGLTWNKALETGGVVVGDEVDLMIDMEFAKQ